MKNNSTENDRPTLTMHMKARILGVSSALLQMLTNLFISCFPPFANACSKRCFTTADYFVTLMKIAQTW